MPRTTFEEAKRKAKYGRRDWLYWVDQTTGEEHAAPKGADTLKSALLANGTKAKFRMMAGGSGNVHAIGWRQGVRMLRNARAGF